MDITNIKKNLHQIWTGNKLPEKYLDLQKSLISTHKDWNYKLWNLDECRTLIEEKYPFFLDIYDNYEFTIQKIDSSRLFILNEYGGLYSDLDIHFLKNIEPLLKGNKACIFESNNQMMKKGNTDNIIIDNYIMYNNNSLFFNEMCKHINYFIKRGLSNTDFLKQTIYRGGGGCFINNFLKHTKLTEMQKEICYKAIRLISIYMLSDSYTISFVLEGFLEPALRYANINKKTSTLISAGLGLLWSIIKITLSSPYGLVLALPLMGIGIVYGNTGYQDGNECVSSIYKNSSNKKV